MKQLIFTSTNTTDSATEKLKEFFKGPIPYIVIGVIVLLVLVVYLLSRNVKAKPNCATIIIRGGKIYKVLDENNPSYYLVPFRDRVGAVIPLTEQELASDKLYINNGPDALYRINYVLKYKVADPTEFYQYLNSFQNTIISDINDVLREYADQGNALILVKDYRKHEKEILSLFNKASNPYSAEVASFKFNFIEPLGKK